MSNRYSQHARLPSGFAELDRLLSPEEHHLAEWLLQHGEANASRFIPQLAVARVRAQWDRGGPTIRIEIPETTPSVPSSHEILARMVGTIGDERVGVILRQQDGRLCELETYAFTGSLHSFMFPDTATLRPLGDSD